MQNKMHFIDIIFPQYLLKSKKISIFVFQIQSLIFTNSKHTISIMNNGLSIILKGTAAVCMLLSTTCIAVAQHVDIATAQSVAQRVLQGNSAAPSSIATTLAWESSDLFPSTRGEADDASFYVFQTGHDKGFIIVAADKRICPILGYSDQYAVTSPDNIPINMYDWLKYVDTEVKQAREENTAPHPEWDAIPTRSSNSEKVLETAIWNQSEPYNRQCPMHGDRRSLTGCTATATGIIMYYHRWPESAWGTTPAYQTSTNAIQVPARDINHTYDWDNMLPSYTDNNYTDAQADAVATLLADIGHAYQANYGSEATGALPDMEWLIDNFQYSPGTNYLYRNTQTKESWNQAIRHEIDNNRPMLYSGFERQAAYGHAFIIDGYNNNDFFHVNWGWSGDFNGFYRLEDLRPNIYDLSYLQWILIGFEPYREQGDFPNWVSIVGNLRADCVEPAQGVPFSISQITFINTTQRQFDGKIRIAHTNAEGEIKSWISEEADLSVTKGYYTSAVQDIACNISEAIEPNDRIRVFYRSTGDEWFLATPYGYSPGEWEIVLQETIPSIAESTAISFNNETKVLVITHDHRVRAKVTCNGTEVANVIYEQACTIIDTKQFDGQLINIHLENSKETRDFTITINSNK